MPKYRHARRGGELAGEAAEAAKVWASDRPIQNNTPTTTPYGSYPGAKEAQPRQLPSQSVLRDDANRFGRNHPAEAAGLVRLMKWTYRLHTRAPLSVNRGITCAAFSWACHQAAAMKLYLHGQGVLNKLNTANMGKIDGLLESKEVLQARSTFPRRNLSREL